MNFSKYIALLQLHIPTNFYNSIPKFEPDTATFVKEIGKKRLFSAVDY